MGATNRLGWAAVAALFCALPVIAHHSFAAEFDSDKTVTLRGTISKVDWVNPHIFVYLDVKDDAGKTTTWELQSLPPLFFRGSGLTKDVMLSNKQEVTVTANPAKDGTPGLRVHDQVELCGRPCIQHVSPGCRPQSEEDAE